jgi:hypothetical protein
VGAARHLLQLLLQAENGLQVQIILHLQAVTLP